MHVIVAYRRHSSIGHLFAYVCTVHTGFTGTVSASLLQRAVVRTEMSQAVESEQRSWIGIKLSSFPIVTLIVML